MTLVCLPVVCSSVLGTRVVPRLPGLPLPLLLELSPRRNPLLYGTILTLTGSSVTSHGTGFCRQLVFGRVVTLLTRVVADRFVALRGSGLVQLMVISIEVTQLKSCSFG